MTSTLDIPKAHSIGTLTETAYEKLTRNESGTPVLTITLPTEIKGAETRKNSIVFKNALRAAKEELEQSHATHLELEEQLKHLEPLTEDGNPFWQHQEKGLVVILKMDKEPEFLTVPIKLEQTVTLESTPNLTSLAPLMATDDAYVIVLDLNHTRLFSTGARNVQELTFEEGTPTSFDAAMRYDDPEEQLQNRSSGSGETGNFHGQGVTGDETQNKKLVRFFEKLVNGIPQSLKSQDSPIVLLGPEREVGLFRKVCDWKQLSEEAVYFNPSEFSDDQLKSKLEEIAHKFDEEATTQNIEKIRNAIGQSQGSTEFTQIAMAAYNGRVETLIIDPSAKLYGKVNEEQNTADAHATRGPADVNMIALTIDKTLRNGGTVITSEKARDVSKGGVAAAHFRY